MSEGEKQEILNLIADWRNALENKDFDRLFANYSPDVVFYDCKPPHQLVGIPAIKAMWEECSPHLPARFRSEHRDLSVRVNNNLAFVHGLHRFVALVDEEKWKNIFTWVRITVCYAKIDGKWMVVHEHCSMPFDPLTGMVSLIV